jgi:hypothetical protein
MSLAFREHQRITQAILLGRALRCLPEELEDRLIDESDPWWCQMTDAERQETDRLADQYHDAVGRGCPPTFDMTPTTGCEDSEARTATFSTGAAASGSACVGGVIGMLHAGPCVHPATANGNWQRA